MDSAEGVIAFGNAKSFGLGDGPSWIMGIVAWGNRNDPLAPIAARIWFWGCHPAARGHARSCALIAASPIR
jgi:hypothetical protein